MKLRPAVVVSVIALLASGVYVFVYLVRWEWHRAIISALLFLVAEVAVLGLMFAGWLRRLESKVDDLGRRARVDEHLAAAAKPHESPFKWLQDTDHLSVFVPILLGAGVVISALAWVVERFAHVTAGSVLARRLAVDLVPITVAPGALSARVPLSQPASSTRSSRAPLWAAAVVLAAVTFVALDQIGDATQNRPDSTPATSTSRIIVEVHSVIPNLDASTGAANLWGACVPQLGGRFQRLSTDAVGGATVAFTVRPAVGKYAERRLRGCFEDSTSDRMAARVLAVQRL